MENLQEMLASISELKTRYDVTRENNRFNIITALHKERDEENLHSRFISYLLSPTSGHGMNAVYTELFIRDILKLNSVEFNLSDFKVFPNERQKSEYKYIDILIVNKAQSQAIIIENKIDAKDCNDESKIDGYKGQLERYYNTIKRGIDKDDKPCPEYQCNDVYVYYLSNNAQPSEDSIGMLKNEPKSWRNENIISYEYNIREWLRKCIESTPEKRSMLKEFIQHYLKLIDKITHNDMPTEERIDLKRIVSENIESSKYLIDNFKHVKWHTVYEFWKALFEQLRSANYQPELYPAQSNVKETQDKLFTKTITEVTHLGKDINHGILFDLRNGTRAYISGLGKLTWGIVEPKMWVNFENEVLQDISFSSFSTENTYHLTDKRKMEYAIETIIGEIKEAQDNNLDDQKSLKMKSS